MQIISLNKNKYVCFYFVPNCVRVALKNSPDNVKLHIGNGKTNYGQKIR